MPQGGTLSPLVIYFLKYKNKNIMKLESILDRPIASFIMRQTYFGKVSTVSQSDIVNHFWGYASAEDIKSSIDRLLKRKTITTHGELWDYKYSAHIPTITLGPEPAIHAETLLTPEPKKHDSFLDSLTEVLDDEYMYNKIKDLYEATLVNDSYTLADKVEALLNKVNELNPVVCSFDKKTMMEKASDLDLTNFTAFNENVFIYANPELKLIVHKYASYNFEDNLTTPNVIKL